MMIRAQVIWSSLTLACLAAGIPWLASAWQSPSTAPGMQQPPAPEATARQIRIAPGLRVELVAAEPVIESPVAMAFDEAGKLWVVEMRDYPNAPPPGQPPEGRIKFLEDRDGDGRYETSTVFVDQMLFANGVLPWKGGVLVTAAPDIVHLQDTDSDGKADRREVLFEGFAVENPQLRVSHPNLGIDNYVYVANGLRGGTVKRGEKPDGPVTSLRGMDFRFDPTNPDRHEAISGLGQYGNTFDDWGRRFVCDNRHHLRHIVLPNQYIQRNPDLAVPAVLQDVSELEMGPLNSGVKIFPLSKNWTTSSLHAGRFTAACSVFIYRGNLLPAEYRGAAFTCDPTGNLVHQEVLQPHGATFRSRPAREGVEFLASPDDWFRPVFLAHGPDGAMYLVDMCRAVIEHPEFMPTELKKRPDLTWGKDRGRIWRIVPDAARTEQVKPNLSKAALVDLITHLESPDAWWRTTAQRLLLERQDPAAVGPLRQLIATTRKPLARVHAAWLLRHFDVLDQRSLITLLQDVNPRVREHAVRLAEGALTRSELVRQHVLAMAADADAQVRFQVALSLGEWDEDSILVPLAQIALTGVDDHWTRWAVATAIPKRASALLATLFKLDLAREKTADRLLLVQELSRLVGARRDPGEVATLLGTLNQAGGADSAPWQLAGLNGLAEGMARRGAQLGAFLKSLPPPYEKLSAQVDPFLIQAATLAADTSRPLGERLDAIQLLAHAAWPSVETVLPRLLKNDLTQEVRVAAARALAAHPQPEIPGLLMKAWRTYTPAVRREVIEAMLRQPDRLHFLLDELEAGRIKPSDLDAIRTRQLLNHGRSEIRARARKLLQDNLPADRRQVLEQYQSALTRPGDGRRGRQVFKDQCATCHRVAAVGVDVGPDIADSRTKTPEQLLLDILNPNAAIDSNYINYVVSTKSGKVLTGMLAAETASSITLRRAENQTEVVLRSEIEEIQSTGQSLMPEGLEKTITVDQMADLLVFLKNWRYLDGTVPLGKP